MKRIVEIIEKQRAGKEGLPEWVVGEQLLDIASESELNRELIEHDLETSGMKLSDAAAALKKYADEHHGKAREFCIIPSVADKILRKFYGIGERNAADAAPTESSPKESGGFVDLGEYL